MSSKTHQLTVARKTIPLCRQFLLITMILAVGSMSGMAQTTEQPVNPQPLPTVTVTGTNQLAEEALMGPNRQPEWTARRPFGITRVYVQPPWQMQTEFGWDA